MINKLLIAFFVLILSATSCPGGWGVTCINFRRGDTNGDSTVDIADALFVMNWLFSGGPAPTCNDATDANDDSSLDISDSIYLLNWLFVNGPVPGSPGPFGCGLDPSQDSLDCLLASGC